MPLPRARNRSPRSHTLLMVPVNPKPLQEAPSAGTPRATGRGPLPRVSVWRLGRGVLVVARRRGVEAISAARRRSGWGVRKPSALGDCRRGVRVGGNGDVAVHLLHLGRDVPVADGSLGFSEERAAVAGHDARDRDVVLGDGGVGRGVCVRVGKTSVPIFRGVSALRGGRAHVEREREERLTAAEGLRKAGIPGPGPGTRGCRRFTICDRHRF